jgi:hypothetical protein
MNTLCTAALVAVSLLTSHAPKVNAQPRPPAVDPAKVELTVTASAAETVIEKGATNAKPLKLTFAFKNVSKEAIELNTTALDLDLLRLEVTGPDGKPVPAMFVAVPAPPGVSPRPVIGSQKLAAGETWEHKNDAPGVWARQRGSNTVYTFDKPGTYKIKAVYNGNVKSKEIELKVKAAEK